MSYRDVKAWLAEFVEKIRCALWLNEKSFDAGRRAVLFGACAVVAASALAQVPGYRPVADLYDAEIIPSAISEQLRAVTRRAFMPRVYVQVWKSSPLMSSLLENAS